MRRWTWQGRTNLPSSTTGSPGVTTVDTAATLATCSAGSGGARRMLHMCRSFSVSCYGLCTISSVDFWFWNRNLKKMQFYITSQSQKNHYQWVQNVKCVCFRRNEELDSKKIRHMLRVRRTEGVFWACADYYFKPKVGTFCAQNAASLCDLLWKANWFCWSI